MARAPGAAKRGRPVRKDLGVLLKRAREDAQLSMSSVARQAGVPQSTVTRIEAGGSPGASFRTIALVADVLGVSLDALAERSGLRTPSARRSQLVDNARPLVLMIENLQREMAGLEL